MYTPVRQQSNRKQFPILYGKLSSGEYSVEQVIHSIRTLPGPIQKYECVEKRMQDIIEDRLYLHNYGGFYFHNSVGLLPKDTGIQIFRKALLLCNRVVPGIENTILNSESKEMQKWCGQKSIDKINDPEILAEFKRCKPIVLEIISISNRVYRIVCEQRSKQDGRKQFIEEFFGISLEIEAKSTQIAESTSQTFNEFLTQNYR